MQPESSFLRCEYRKENIRGLYSRRKFKKGEVVCTEVPTALLLKDDARTELDLFPVRIVTKFSM